tara:strand:- start:19212 stop:19436 length:225 start_codon:yes stop_codon:yes gene_type:complete
LGRLIRAFCRVRIRGQIGNDLIDCKNDIGKKQKAKMAIIADVQGIEKTDATIFAIMKWVWDLIVGQTRSNTDES